MLPSCGGPKNTNTFLQKARATGVDSESEAAAAQTQLEDINKSMEVNAG